MSILKLFATVLLAGTICPSLAAAQMQAPTATLEGGLTYGVGTGRLGITVPFALDDGGLLFLEATGGAAEDQVRYGSFGAGWRTRLAAGPVLGIHAYYDVLRTSRANTFHQLSLGGEIIGDVFEARADVYLPVTGAKLEEEFNRAFVSDGALLFQSGSEQARRGLDVEAGVRLPVFPSSDRAQMKLFGGTYWYDGKNMDDTFGGKLRAEVSFAGLPGVRRDATLSFGAEASYDNEEHAQFGLMAKLRIPLGAAKGTEKPFDRLTQPVERSWRVRTHAGSTGAIEAAAYATGGEKVGKVVNIGSSDTATTANAALTAAGRNALALANGDIALAQALTLGAGQHLLGGGGTLAVRGAESGLSAVFGNDGPAARLHGTDATRNVIEMGSGSEVVNVAITGGAAGIHAFGTSELSIRDVDISATAGDGIRLENVSGATVASSTIHDLFICESSTQCEFSVYNPNAAPFAAISALGTSGLEVRDTTIANVTYGIFAGSRVDDSDWPPVLANEASRIVVDDVSITNSRREGILLVAADDVTMRNVAIDNSALERSMDLVVLQGTSDVKISDMSLKGGINGLMLVSASSLPTVTTNVAVDGLRIEGTSNAGIFLNPVSGIRFSNVSISNAGTYGVFIYGSDYDFLGGPVKDIAFDGLSIDHANTAGLYFMGPSVNLSGDVAVTGTPRDCLVSAFGSTVNGSLTQEDGSVLTLNRTPLNGANFQSRCLP